MIDPLLVAITETGYEYPDPGLNPRFDPSEGYPEYPFDEVSSEPNEVYAGVRRLLRLMKLDEENYGTPQWNPLGDMIKPGDNVVIKPNFVRHHHRLGKPVEAIITHGSIIRPILDYAYIALQGIGELVVADAPQGDTNFEKLIEVNGVDKIFEWYRSMGSDSLLIDLIDIRKEWTPYKHGVIWERITLKGDPKGYSTIALDEKSEFVPKEYKDYYGADPDRDRTKKFHHEGMNRYNVARTILDADVFISVPKLKVHRKVGVTLNIKNLIGINGEKNFLPHFTIGSPETGGDEFSNDTWNNKIDRKLKDLLLWKNPTWGKYAYLGWHAADKLVFRKIQPKQSFVKGDWHGNDTTWRAAVDLTKIILYADRDGKMHSTQQRRYMSIIDGVVGGDKEGPLTPDPEYSGVILGGTHPTIVDIFATLLMGFDWKKFRMFTGAVDARGYSIVPEGFPDYSVESDIEHDFTQPLFDFTPPAGWIGHVEWEGKTHGASTPIAR